MDANQVISLTSNLLNLSLVIVAIVFGILALCWYPDKVFNGIKHLVTVVFNTIEYGIKTVFKLGLILIHLCSLGRIKLAKE